MLGVSRRSLNTVWLERRPTPFGVRLWRMDPVGEGSVRAARRGVDLDALKVIDFYAPAFDAACAELAHLGYRPREAVARYDLPAGRFQEAHYWRPDDLVCALVSGPPDFFRDFATLCDQRVSEPQSISAPVSDAPAAIDFYRNVFDFEVLFEYAIENESFDDLVGSEEHLSVRAVNVGTSSKTPYLGLIDYGLKGIGGETLHGRSRPPARGLTGIEIVVNDVEETVQRVPGAGGVLLSDPGEIADYPPYGRVACSLVEGPHGVIHHLIENRP